MAKNGDFVHTLRANRVIRFYKVDKQVLAEKVQEKSIENLSRGDYLGTVSEKNRKRIFDILTYWYESTVAWKSTYPHRTKRELQFLTLTLPYEQMNGDNEIKRQCLNFFLIRLQRTHNRDPYLWKAERQKNGRLHFHLVIDTSFGTMDYRQEWNKCLNRLGYVDYYKMKMENWHKDGFRVRTDLLGKYDELTQMYWYIAGMRENWENPNTTFIEPLQGGTKIAEYVGKYIGKNGTDEGIEGRVWGCSDVLRGIKPFEFVAKDYPRTTVEKYLSHTSGIIEINDFCRVYKMVSAFHFLNKNSSLYRRFKEYLLDTYNNIYGVHLGKSAWNNFQ